PDAAPVPWRGGPAAAVPLRGRNHDGEAMESRSCDDRRSARAIPLGSVDPASPDAARRRTAPRRTTVPRTPRSRILSLTAGTAASAGLGMIPMHRLPRTVQGAYVLLPAALTTGLLLRALLRRD